MNKKINKNYWQINKHQDGKYHSAFLITQVTDSEYFFINFIYKIIYINIYIAKSYY